MSPRAAAATSPTPAGAEGVMKPLAMSALLSAPVCEDRVLSEHACKECTCTHIYTVHTQTRFFTGRGGLMAPHPHESCRAAGGQGSRTTGTVTRRPRTCCCMLSFECAPLESCWRPAGGRGRGGHLKRLALACGREPIEFKAERVEAKLPVSRQLLGLEPAP